MNLQDINPSDNQQVFDFIVERLLAQDRQSVNSKGICQYRGLQGAKCAAGWLIPNREYRKEFEGYAVLTNFFDCPPSQYFKDRGFNLDFLVEMQKAHDLSAGIVFRDGFLALANRVAGEFNLRPYEPPSV